MSDFDAVDSDGGAENRRGGGRRRSADARSTAAGAGISWCVNADIRRACTPPLALYCDAEIHRLLTERVLAHAWHFVGDRAERPPISHARRVQLLPGVLDESIAVVTSGDGTTRWLSNACTHRGHPVVCSDRSSATLRCRYHGRRFHLDGTLTAAPGFDGVPDFPGPGDHLPQLAHAEWGPLDCVSLDPALPAGEWLAPLQSWLRGLPAGELAARPALHRDHEVDANWMLYVENYLEGLHIPYVHGESLLGALDLPAYECRLLPHGAVQFCAPPPGEPSISLPAEHPLGAREVAALYVWLFPHLMLNFYPWGLSLNAVEPTGAASTRVRYRVYTWNEDLLESGAGAGLDRVEEEDQRVVAAIQGIAPARLYRGGRYAPEAERGPHHFHRLLASAAGWSPDPGPE